jgi:hypothetical protein
MNANVINKMVDDKGRHVVQIDCKMTNQAGGILATAKAEIELSKRD